MSIALAQIQKDEGLRLAPYRDTEGLLTIGYGRNLDHNGITEAEATYLLTNDLGVARLDAERFASPAAWSELTDDRRAVLINMAFNLGLSRLNKFTSFKAALRSHEYDQAADQMLDSRWARQVGARASRLADIMRG